MSAVLHVAVLLTLVVVNVWAIQFHQGFCPDGWLESEHSGTCIENVRYQDETWFRAMLNCGYNFAQLPNIINAKMNKFLFDMYSWDHNNSYWIGANDRNHRGYSVYQWQRHAVTYTNWAPNQPRSRGKYRGCATINYPGVTSGTWVDRDCNIKQTYTCEKSPKYCTDIWQLSKYSGTCIKIFQFQVRWELAREVCARFSSDLVEIVNDRMNDFITDQVAHDHHGYWTGMHRKKGGKFVWVATKNEASYTKWNSGEPSDNFRNEDYQCVQTNQPNDERGTWKTSSCLKKLKIICEKKIIY